MDTSKDVCTYYTLCGQEDNYGNTILEKILREPMQNCLSFIQKETLLQTNACKIVQCRGHIIFNRTPKFHPNIFVKALSTPGFLKRIIINYCHWIICKIRKISKKCSRGNLKRQPCHKAGSCVFQTCTVIHHCIQTGETQVNSCVHLH